MYPCTIVCIYAYACRHALDQGSRANLSRRPRIHPVGEHFFKEISQRDTPAGATFITRGISIVLREMNAFTVIHNYPSIFDSTAGYRVKRGQINMHRVLGFDPHALNKVEFVHAWEAACYNIACAKIVRAAGLFR